MGIIGGYGGFLIRDLVDGVILDVILDVMRIALRCGTVRRPWVVPGWVGLSWAELSWGRLSWVVLCLAELSLVGLA